MTVTGGASNPPRCPYNAGQSYIDDNGQVYIIVCDAAFEGEIIETSDQRSFLDCMTQCDNYNKFKTDPTLSDCGGINYNNATTIGNCFLTDGDVIGASPGIWSGRLIKRAVDVVTATATGPGSAGGTGAGPTSYLVSTAPGDG